MAEPVERMEKAIHEGTDQGGRATLGAVVAPQPGFRQDPQASGLPANRSEMKTVM